MKPSFDIPFLCRCSECDTVFRLAASQLASHAGLVRCGDCGTVFNAAWNLVDEIPNPVGSLTPVAPISSIRHGRDNTLVETTENEDDGPGFAVDKRLFSLDDQLRQDLQLGPDDPGALEEIRRTLGPTDIATKPEQSRIQSERRARQAQQENTAHRTRSEPRFTKSTPLDSEVRQAANWRPAGRLSRSLQARTQGLWFLAVLVVATGLFMQVRYWLFDELSAIPSARAPLEAFCRLAGCNVPAPLMGPAFRVLQTRVDLDPQLPSAVIVKVHLVNRTVTPRPYPAIQLTLTDREGETIGKRTYTAEDYSTPADASELPADSVAVISLHLTSPDESAVGFEASIVDTGM
jgi:predicted Zn finger-like uncharacterized protein